MFQIFWRSKLKIGQFFAKFGINVTLVHDCLYLEEKPSEGSSRCTSLSIHLKMLILTTGAKRENNRTLFCWMETIPANRCLKREKIYQAYIEIMNISRKKYFLILIFCNEKINPGQIKEFFFFKTKCKTKHTYNGESKFWLELFSCDNFLYYLWRYSR